MRLADTPAEVDAMLPPLLVDIEATPSFSLALPATRSYLGWAHHGGTCSYDSSIIASTADDPPLDLGNVWFLSYVTDIDRAGARAGFGTPAMPCE